MQELVQTGLTMFVQNILVFIGALAAIWSPKLSRVARIIFDWNGPGAIALTVIAGASRLARWRVSWCTAALADE